MSKQNDDFGKILENSIKKSDVPRVGNQVEGVVISANSQEVKLNINGIWIGVVRGPQLYKEDAAYDNLQPGMTVPATIVEEENERGELELSFRVAGQEKAWDDLKEAYENKDTIKIRIIGANRGGLMASFRQIAGFLPVSQLSPEHYPRVSGGDKTKILEKLKKFVDEDLSARVSTFDPKEGKIIFSEKDLWSEQQQEMFSRYKDGDIIEGTVSAIADFGVFVNFGESLEGLIHISEIAWKRIDHPGAVFKVGDKVRAKIISINGTKIFLSTKRLSNDPWQDAEIKYPKGAKVKGKILKINPFGLFVELDPEIHGLAHISQIGLKGEEKPEDLFKIGEERDFIVASIQIKDHRLGLNIA